VHPYHSDPCSYGKLLLESFKVWQDVHTVDTAVREEVQHSYLPLEVVMQTQRSRRVQPFCPLKKVLMII